MLSIDRIWFLRTTTSSAQLSASTNSVKWPNQFSFLSQPIFSVGNQPKMVSEVSSSSVGSFRPPIELIKPTTPISQAPTQTLEQIPQPPAPSILRRLSSNSIDAFIDELYEGMLNELIKETINNIFQ